MEQGRTGEGARPHREDAEQFRRLVESVRDYAIFLLDREGHVTTWNVGAQRIKGYRAEEIIGRHFSTFYSREEVASGKCEYELEVAAQVGRFEDEGWRLRKDGSRFWANVIISAVRGDAGELLGFSKVTRDLTERKRAEEERAARRAAEEASRAKDAFLAMLGHELRNPLAPIVTALELVKLRSGGLLSREHQVIERQVGHLQHLVDDLLDVSRIARGKLSLKRKRLDLRDALATAVEVASPLFEERGHALRAEVPPRALPVEGDAARLTQVFANLLVNAAKYTDPGGHVVLRARKQGEQVVVEVQDDGHGIRPELLPKVFDLFMQGEQGAERSAGGLGLGLTLARLLTTMQGGEIEASSDGVGRGSTFTVRLPLVSESLATTTPSAGVRSAAGPTYHVLVVDDNRDARDMLAEVLAAAGHTVVTAGDAPEALQQVRAARPDVAILDIGLPVMDGYALAERLRAELGADAPRLIALSGYALPRHRERSGDVGFEIHLVKPVEAAALLAAVAPDGD